MSDQQRESRGINRRTVLKTAGMATVGLAAYSGTASATPPTEIRFCGCSQICFGENDGRNFVLYATETEDGYDCELDEVGVEATCETAGDDEKIIGLFNRRLDDYRFFKNPNNCASRALSDLGFDEPAGETVGDIDCPLPDDLEDDILYMFYERVSRHEYVINDPKSVNVGKVIVRTRKCNPPSQWVDNPNGPPNDRGQGPP
ncbi:hypothetical protein [Halapricum desulfuricans]|uniref:Uncharacterized protein n=1 Tax=Halapricum desulfuricans TaxID=2841257 RepID=A0A897NSI7_9EURY|nr:hypothetical protein [Halapricum desulfuricans]QSG15191.1 hypothetical protein HSEST_1667 [Halapricum desulfuricans]